MDKEYICQEALKGIESASKMESVSYDPETRQNKTEFFEVTDIARQSAMDAIKRFQNSDSVRVLIYHGQDNVADYLYYLEIRAEKLTLVREIDYGMKMRHTYNKPETILSGFNELENMKRVLTNGDETKENNEEMITIAKKPGVKDCVRISSENDIPDFLKEAIRVDGENLVLDCLEGEERCPLGSVIAFEKLESGKMNVWNKANWKETTKEVDGVFYELPKPVTAVRITDTVPQSVIDGLGDRFTVLPTGEFQIDAGWGLVKCAPNNGYVVIYGKKEDGSLDANFLTKGTPSFDQYFVLDENGKIVQTLQEYDEQSQPKPSSEKQRY